MAKEQKGVNLYLLSIVAIVAIVGIVILVLNVSGTGMMFGSSDSTGQAYMSSRTMTLGSSSRVWNQDDCHQCSSGEIVCGLSPCSTPA